MNIRKLLRSLHRDFGYFITGMIIIYALSGIYFNHRHDLNPDYKILTTNFKAEIPVKKNYSEDEVKDILKGVNKEVEYKKHYINSQGIVKVFISNGEAVFNPETGEGTLEYLQKRPVIFGMNKLHKASIGTVWKWLSDIMAVILMFVAVSGLFLLKGKRGLVRWGWWLTIAGFVVPLIFALLFI